MKKIIQTIEKRQKNFILYTDETLRNDLENNVF